MSHVFVVQGRFEKGKPKLLRVYKSKESAERYIEEQIKVLCDNRWMFDITEMVLED
jgi:hypothetical protein